ncbi:MFS transporter [Jiangella alba]|uniref:Predicted arabinose efflux permease, MFS family n=1 Tax=Jiangella alba TaxID=561176 RepID=A0A1H5PSL3_9ACTN|nr:MFS transporter [Jiangella alba]SEF16171.1 Predicted arabinose efflux permease, MFS family [Jiangella alba]
MTSPSATLQASAAATGRPPRVTLLVASAATLLVLMNYTAPLATLRDIGASLDLGHAAVTWTLNGVPLGLAALSLAAGSVADDYGRKRVFLVGLGVLAAAMVGGAMAPTATVFVVARVVQGAASAALLASSLGLIAHAHPDGHARLRATTVWGATVSAGIAVGPIVAAAPVPGGWRTAYVVFAVLGVVIAGIGAVVLDESRAPVRRRFDGLGVTTLGLGLSALFTALIQVRDGVTVSAVVFAVAAVALLGGFVLAEWRGREPMLDLRLFARRDFVAATVGALATGVAVIGFFSYLPTLMQQGLGLSAMSTALLSSLWAGIAFVVALEVRRLARHWPGWAIVSAGLGLSAVGTVALLGFLDAGSWQRLLPGLVVAGVGSGLVNGILPRLAVDSVPPRSAAMGSGANSAARYVGAAIGVAVAVAVVGAAGPDLSHATDVMLMTGAALAAVSALLMLLLRDRRR